MNNEQVLLQLMEYHGTPDARIWPCLIGPTGSGKTSICRQLSETTNLPLHRLLLGTMLPEDVLGLPRIIDGVTQWSIPKWASDLKDNPGILFMDELDKARTETMSAVLTLCSELMVQDTQLHPKTRIIAAMQPVDIDLWLSDETTKALSARFYFLSNPYNWSYLGKKLRMDLNGITTQNLISPILPDPTPRQVEWLVGLYRFLHTQKLPSAQIIDLTTQVGIGMFSPSNLKIFIDRIDKWGISKESLIAILKEDKEASTLVRQLSIPELIELSGAFFTESHSTTIAEIFHKIWVTGNQEDRKNFMEELHRQLVEKAEAAPDHIIEVAGGDNEDTFIAELNKVASDISKVWEEHNKEKKGLEQKIMDLDPKEDKTFSLGT